MNQKKEKQQHLVAVEQMRRIVMVARLVQEVVQEEAS